MLEDAGFLYQDHHLFAGRHEVSPLTAEVISAKEKAGKCMATLLYLPTVFTSTFFPNCKSSSLNHLQVIFRELKANFSSFAESKLPFTCALWPTITCHLYLWRVHHFHLSFRTRLLFTAQLDPFPWLFCWWSKTIGTVQRSLWSVLLDFNNWQFKIHLPDKRMIAWLAQKWKSWGVIKNYMMLALSLFLRLFSGVV